VNLANGNLLVKENDFAIAGPGYALRHDRFYNGLSTLEGSLGGGWQTNNARDVGLEIGSGFVNYFAPNGVVMRFDRLPGAAEQFTSPDGSNMTLVDTQLSPMRYLLTMNKTGEQLWFSAAGYSLLNYDRNSIGTAFTFNEGAIASVTHASGRSLSMATSGNRVTTVTDSAGRDVAYTYDSALRLETVTAVDGTVTSYTYDSMGRLASIELPSAVASDPTTTVSFTYDSSHRVTKVAREPGIETTFTYAAGQTIVTDANGNDATYGIDASGRVESTQDALGRSRSQTWTANSDIETTTDALSSNTTTYTYDGSNNRVGAQLPTGAAAAAVYAIGVDCSAPNTGTSYQPKCSTDDAGNAKQYEYDSFGNLLALPTTRTGI
jgi:YD repeat-containing protein